MNTIIKRDMVIHRRSSIRVCKDCGKFFVLSDNDAMHYITKYSSLPLRCEECRKRVRESNPLNRANNVTTGNVSGNSTEINEAPDTTTVTEVTENVTETNNN